MEGSLSRLSRPLLATLKAGRTQSTSVSSPGPDPQVWRRHSAPSLDLPKLHHERPPYKSQHGHSILFKAILAVVAYFGIGTLSFYAFGDQLFGTKTGSFIDVLYFCAVTLTTVGYGDLVPGTTVAKVFTCAYTFVGFGLVSVLVGGAANYIVQRQEEIIVHAIRRRERPISEQNEECDQSQAASWKALVSGILVLSSITVGTVFMIKVEGMTSLDAIYCVCVTVTTLGYGDHSFHTAPGRLFAAIWILSSTVFLAQFLLHVAEMRTVNRQRKLAKWVLHRRTTRPDMEAADRDGDGVLNVTEFVIFKLKELGKIDEEDVVGILKEFQNLDYDHSGTISMGDLALVQSS